MRKNGKPLSRLAGALPAMPEVDVQLDFGLVAEAFRLAAV